MNEYVCISISISIIVSIRLEHTPNDFSYIIIDIGSIGLTEFIHISSNRYVDELSVEARVISGQYSAPELLDSIRDCVKTYATDDLLSQVPEETTYVVTDADLGNFLEHKIGCLFSRSSWSFL